MSKTIAELEDLLAAHGIRKCELCGEYEKPKKGFEGIGGIQSDDMGRTGDGRVAHAKCVLDLSRKAT